jgi:protoporphyrinogen/coproporphyrinogen III oxidase
MKSVAIIGAGITGLTAAFYLKRKGLAVTVYEASSRVGGVIQSLRQDGYLAEFGPNTLLETSPKIAQLVRDAGLESRRLDPDPKAEARFVVRYGRPIAMPAKPPGFFTTDLFSWRAKLAVLREPFIRPRRDGVEESIGQFVVRRFNQEFLDHAIDALVAGIYAGDPNKLSVVHAFPKLKALEDNYGSMIKGQIFGARERKKRGEVAKDRAPKFSFDEGLQVLTDTLARHLGDAVKLNTAVRQLTKNSSGWTVHAQTATGGTLEEHDAVIFCGTAPKLAELEINVGQTFLSASSGDFPVARAVGTASGQESPGNRQAGKPALQKLELATFSEIRYPPVASVVLGFRREDVAHDCCGFGMLIPKIAGFKSLGTIFSSALFPNRAPAGHHTLTTYIGGERYPELALLPPDKQVALVCEDLKVLLGVRGQPTFQHVVVYPKAIPQYNVGYGRFKELMSQLEAQSPGFHLAGHYRDGVSLSDSIVSGINISDRVATALAHSS